MEIPHFWARTINGQNLPLGCPASFKLNRSLDSPADSFEAVFELERSCPKLLDITSSGMAGFSGMVDRQATVIKSTGMQLLVEARSCGGVLLDNEAQPQSYFGATLEDIFRLNLSSLGFSLEADRNPKLSSFSAERSMCVWEVLADFCRGAELPPPRIKQDGVIAVKPVEDEQPVLISNKGAAGELNFISIQDVFKRAGLPSEIYVQTDRNCYGLHITNELASEYKLSRKRYILPNQEFTQNPRQDAVQRIKKANLSARIIKAALPGLCKLNPGQTVRIDDRMCKAENFYIHEICYSLEKSGMTTSLTLADKRFL